MSILMVWMALPPPAFSQTTLEEIVVTAQKREQSAQDVPISITALSGGQLAVLGMTNAKDIAEQVPGVILAAVTTGGGVTLPTIRGVTQNDFTLHQEAPNAVYIDETYISSPAAIDFSLFDVQRVEVLRGPQGTLFGRNATGGAIQFVTNKPTKNTDGYVDLQYGSFDSRRVEAAIGGAIVDRIQGRLSVLYQDDGPWWENKAPPTTPGGNSDTFAKRSAAARGQLNFDITDDVQDLLSVTRAVAPKHAEGTYKSIPGAVNSLGLGYDIPANINANGTCPGCDDFGYRDPNIGTPFESSFASVGFNQRNFSGITNRLTWKAGAATLTSLTNYQKFFSYYQENCDGTPFAACIFFLGQNMHQLSQELRLNGASGALTWTAGAYFLDISQSNYQGYATELTPTSPLAIFRFADRENFAQSTTTEALFGQTEYEFAPRWTLVSGLRFNYDRKKFHSETALPGEAPYYTYPETGGSAVQNKADWAGKLQVDWKATADALLYAGVSKGNKGPGFNATPLGALPSGNSVEFKAEELTDYEVGWKLQTADHSIRLNGSMYYYDYRAYQAFEYILLNSVVTNNDAKLFGGELELAADLGAGWTISTGLSLENGNVYNVRLPLGEVVDRIPPMMPHITANGIIQKKWPLAGGWLSIEADGRYTSWHYASVSNAPTTLIPGATLVNGRIGFLDSSGHWETDVRVENIANRGAVVYVYDLAGNYGLNLKSYNEPRRITAEVRYRF
jgi:iron complex outermembrane receptor protein